MLLHNLQSINGNIIEIRIIDGKIRITDNETEINKVASGINFHNALVFPGLINSHDHLDFNLFPQTGNKKYRSYVDWGNDIHSNNKDIINEVLRVPFEIRYLWGIYKNLLNGVTTVVNHSNSQNIDAHLIRVFEQCHVLHSVQFEKFWRFKLNKPCIKKFPFVIHIGEGVDESCHLEIDSLLRWNLLNRDIVGVHGIAMNEIQAINFKGIIWCPASNYFLIGETAPVNHLKQVTNIVFGTDSTLSATWNLWEHLRNVRGKNIVTDAELFDMITIKPARIWNLKGLGQIKQDYTADLVVARNKGNSNIMNSFFDLDPEDILMVFCQGEIKLFDDELYKQLEELNIPMKNFSRVRIKNNVKYIYGDLPGLMSQVHHYYPRFEFPVEIV